LKIGLGTVQFGMNYGIANQNGKTPLNEVKAILHIAQQEGIEVLDTAYAYGESEALIGQTLPDQHAFRIITKTPIFKKAQLHSDDAEHLKVTFYHSLQKLKQEKVAGLLIHHVDEVLNPGGELLVRAMQQLKEDGLVEKIGISVYTGDQIDRLLKKYAFDIIQLPVNVLDQRLVNSGHLTTLKKRGIEIHARSLFLQGLLLMNPDKLPPYFDSIKNHLNKYHEIIYQQGLSGVQAALSFVLGLKEIDVVVFGVNNCQQLREILSGLPRLNLNIMQTFSQFAISQNSILDPSKWRL